MACTIREATLADYRDVMAIGEIYDGFDFLPDMYQDFIKDPDYHCFVCLVDGEIIGFLAALLMDEGTAFDLRAGRVKETHRRRGYYTALRHHVYTFMSKMNTVKYEKSVVCNEQAEKLTCPDSGFEVLALHNMTRFDIPKGIGSDVKSKLQPLTLNDLLHILSCPQTNDQLFPDGLARVNSVPFTAEVVNLHKIFDKRTIVYGTKISGENYTLLSAGCAIKLRLGYRYSLDFFGIDTYDFRTHFLAHLAYIRRYYEGSICFSIATHPRFPADCLDQITNMGGIKTPIWGDNEYTLRRKL